MMIQSMKMKSIYNLYYNIRFFRNDKKSNVSQAKMTEDYSNATEVEITSNKSSTKTDILNQIINWRKYRVSRNSMLSYYLKPILCTKCTKCTKCNQK